MLTKISHFLVENILKTINEAEIGKLIYNINNNNTDKLIEHFINEMMLSQTNVDKININTSRVISHLHGDNAGFIKHFLNDNDYLSPEIRHYIKTKKSILIKYTFNLSRNYHIYFVVYEEKLTREIQNIYNNYVKHILSMILFLENYRKNGCKTEKLELYIFMTPFKKMFPNTKSEIISSENINGGYTIPCQISSQIFIWRKEEFFKVFIHEMFHSLGIDFAMLNHLKLNNDIYNIFPIKDTKFNIYEGYTEFWTELINIVYYVSMLYNDALMIDNSIKITNFINIFNQLYEIEKVWTYIQCIKILNHMNLTYKQLISNNKKNLEKYKENTNVFAYFICKLIFMYNHNKFIEFSIKNNSNLLLFTNDYNQENNQKKIENIFLYIKHNYKNKNLIKIYTILSKFLQENSDIYNNKNVIFKSFRWTSIEYF